MKPWYLSKTLWANALAVAVIAAKYYLKIDSLPTVDPTILALINLLLRVITSKPLTA